MPIKGFAKHLAQIMDTWEGSSATLKVKTSTLDTDGQVTAVAYASYSIIGSFPAMPHSVNRSKIGYMEEGTITTYLQYDTTIPIPAIDDKIVFDGNWFEIMEEPKIDYDNEVPVGFSCELRRVPNES
jgi:hypothetical protein